MSSPPSSLSSSQARFVYWFSGLAPVATNVVTPFMVYYRVRKQPLTTLKRQEMVMQEVARQIVSGTIGILTYFGGGQLTKNIIELLTGRNNPKINDSTKQIAMLVGGTLLSFIGYGFIRPMFSTDIILHWLGQRNQGITPSVTHIGQASGRKAGVLIAGFMGLLLTTDLLNRWRNQGTSSNAMPVQPLVQPLPDNMQAFAGHVTTRRQFRGWA
jgi:hypothetical protein